MPCLLWCVELCCAVCCVVEFSPCGVGEAFTVCPSVLSLVSQSTVYSTGWRTFGSWTGLACGRAWVVSTAFSKNDLVLQIRAKCD